MNLEDFHKQIQAEVANEIESRTGYPGKSYPYAESIFTEIVMEHMFEIGMTFEPTVCHFSAKIANANVRLSGYAVSDDVEQVDIFVSIYKGLDTIESINDTETKNIAEQCLRFITVCAEGKLTGKIEQTNEVFEFAYTIEKSYNSIDQIRVYVITDLRAKSRYFKARDVKGKTILLEVMDIERLYNHCSEGKPRDELMVNFLDLSGNALPCVYVPGELEEYDYALTAIPGEALRYIYEKFGQRLLEANVRSFLSVTGKVNKGIRETLRENPERFMAYNNGIVLIADEAIIDRAKDGSPGLVALKGMQIVNGGQTTASLYFSKKKLPEIRLEKVRIPAKIIVLRSKNQDNEELLISDISKYANTQNVVRTSDLSANNPFHIEIEKISMTTFCPNGEGRWFYERAAGSYNTMLAREGNTPSKLKYLREKVAPSSRKITKTDLAKYLNTWDKKPHIVSLGAQKNYERFMIDISDDEKRPVPDLLFYKTLIAKAILFKKANTLVKPRYQAFQANITVYLLSILSDKIGDKIDFMKIWNRQGISEALENLLITWSSEVNNALQKSANGRMISEWAKNQNCWEYIRGYSYSSINYNIPEIITK